MPTEQGLLRSERFLRTIRRIILMGYVLSALFFLLGIVAFSFEAHFVLASVRTQGQVTKVAPLDDKLDRATYTFRDEKGAIHSGYDSCFRGGYRVGDAVNVLYLPQKPRRSKVARFANQWILAAVSFPLCAIMLVPGMWLRPFWRKMRGRLDEAWTTVRQ